MCKCFDCIRWDHKKIIAVMLLLTVPVLVFFGYILEVNEAWNKDAARAYVNVSTSIIGGIILGWIFCWMATGYAPVVDKSENKLESAIRRFNIASKEYEKAKAEHLKANKLTSDESETLKKDIMEYQDRHFQATEEYGKMALEKDNKEPPKPLPTEEYLGSTILQKHSLDSALYEIIKHVNTRRYTDINITGKTGTGKTELARGIAYVLCTRLSNLTGKPYKKLDINLKALGTDANKAYEDLPDHAVIIFDDMSFIDNTLTREALKQVQAFTKMIQEGPKKIIAIFVRHYSVDHRRFFYPPQFVFQMNAGGTELHNLIGHFALGGVEDQTKTRRYLDDFERRRLHANNTGNWLEGSTDAEFIYPWSRPFRLCLFWNGVILRTVVFPQARALEGQYK